jgi:two-component system OmpR family sensor kinase
MTSSLRRTLALRSAATVAAGLIAGAVAVFWGASHLFHHAPDQAALGIAAAHYRLAIILAGIVIAVTGAAYVGARILAGWAVRPVAEITEQATRIAAGTLGQRISAHASTDEYRGLVAVLNRMLERLDLAFSAQRRFTSDVSHELRTPLTSLRGEIEVALRNERSPLEYQRVLRSGLEEIDRLTTMTEELLLISRAEAGLITPEREPTTVEDLVDASVERFRRPIRDKGLTIDRLAIGRNGGTRVDPELMRRLIDELVENAVGFCTPGGRVTVRVEHVGEHLRLVVEDSGPGIAPEDLPHIFEPYYRADQARTSGARTGLGLTAAAAVARLHGGEIHAANRPEGGARFEVDVPARLPS